MCDRAEEIRRAGAELIVIGNGTPQQARWFVEEQRVPVPVLTDPDLASFHAVGAKRGALSSLRPETVFAALRAWWKGFRQSRTGGDPLQQGAVWIVRPGGEVVWRYTSEFAGDHPDPDRILAALRREPPSEGRRRCRASAP